MDAAHYFEEIDHFLNTYKLKIEDDKKEIADCQKKFSNILNTFTQKTPSNSVINSLFKDEEPEGFVFSRYEEKRKQLAEQRRAEYNAYLEKKEAERLSKKRVHQEKTDIGPKSILDSVDYERVLAKRKEEEAKFRSMNIADLLHNSYPALNGEAKKPGTPSSSHVSPRTRSNSTSMLTGNFSKAESVSDDIKSNHSQLEERKSNKSLNEENDKLLEERIAKLLEEQRRQMLKEFENELRKNNILKEEVQSLRSSSSAKTSPRRKTAKSEEFPSYGKTGGGGEPVRDSHGNLLALRGQQTPRSAMTYNGSIMSFPSMQQPVKDKMALYREELQKQIEEKKRLEALERAKAHEEEERIAQRIEEQRLKLLKEFEEDQNKLSKRQEVSLRQQERLRMLQEFQERDAEARRKKAPERKAPSPMIEKAPPPPVVQERSNSPPIPAVRTKVLLEKAVEAVPEVVKPENPFSSLAEIRRKIMEEQQKPRNNLKKSYEVMNRRTVQEISDEDDDDDLYRTSTNSYKYST